MVPPNFIPKAAFSEAKFDTAKSIHMFQFLYDQFWKSHLGPDHFLHVDFYLNMSVRFPNMGFVWVQLSTYILFAEDTLTEKNYAGGALLGVME